LSRDTLVWRHGLETWTPAEKIAELAPLLNPVVAAQGATYWVQVNNQREGPFGYSDLQVKLTERSMLVWRQGLKAWTAASDLPELEDLVTKLPPPLPGVLTAIPAAPTSGVGRIKERISDQRQYSKEKWEKLRRVASSQRKLIQAVVATLIVGLAMFVLTIPAGAIGDGGLRMVAVASFLVAIVLKVFLLYYTYLLATDLEIDASPYVLGSLVPVIDLLCLFAINQRAVRLLTREGIHVGFFGTNLPVSPP
jgi:uncharacterized protein (DUF486 family)